MFSEVQIFFQIALRLRTYFIFPHQLISNNNVRKLINPHSRMPSNLRIFLFFQLVTIAKVLNFYFKFVMAQN